MNITLKAPKEITKAHRFVKGALKFSDLKIYYNYFLRLIDKAENENVKFVDTQEFIPEAVAKVLIEDGYTIFGSVIRWDNAKAV